MEQTRLERIKKEQTRLNKIFKELEPNRLKTVDGLIKRASFMRITLEDYEADINENGSVELFTQSEKVDSYERERPVVRLYNTMNKNYQSIMKQLSDTLPKEQAVEINPFEEAKKHFR